MQIRVRTEQKMIPIEVDKTEYVADDGTVFQTPEECKAHEILHPPSALKISDLIRLLQTYPQDAYVTVEAEYDCGFGLAGSDKIRIWQKGKYIVLHADE